LRPIADEVEFGLGGAVTSLGQVVANPFEMGHEEVTFLEVEGKMVLNVDFADAFEKIKEEEGIVGPHETVVDDLAAVNFGRVRREAIAEEGVCFLTELGHDGRINSGSIERTKKHNFVGVPVPVGAEEGKFLLVGAPDGDLMIARFGVEADEVNTLAGAVAEIVKHVVAKKNGKKERKGDGIERVVIDTPSPHEVVNAVDVFLVRFRSKEAVAEPGTTGDAFDVVVVDEHLKKRKNNVLTID